MSQLAAKPERSAEDDGLPRPFEPGTTGWSVADLDDPRVEARWFAEPLEIIEGVLTQMPPAYFDGSYRLALLEQAVAEHARANGIAGAFGRELDIVIDSARVVRADAVWISPDDIKRFSHAANAAGKVDAGRQRIYVPPTLVIECVSPGHELHDWRTKFGLYSEFGVPNHWVLEPLKRSLDCFTLSEDRYVLAAAGTAPDKFNVPYFDGFKVDLGAIFAE